MSDPTLYRETSDPNDPLPPRGAMHRDTPPGSRLAIANAYAVGRLVEAVPVEPCEHGKIDGHEQWSKGETRAGWCDGAGIGGGDD